MTTCHYCHEDLWVRDAGYPFSSLETYTNGEHCLSSPDGWHAKAFSLVWGERQVPLNFRREDDQPERWIPHGQLRLFRAIVGERTESYGINGHKYEREVTYVREPGTYGPDDAGRTDTRVIGHAYSCGACEEGEPEPDW
jgi:hypothetical protein